MSKEEVKASVSILHLSDIHFKKKEKDGFRNYQEDVEEKMLTAINEHVKEHGIPDFTAITGDISHDGKEYKRADDFFKKLKEILPSTTFLPLPGNHDVNRGEVDEFFSLHDIVTKGETDPLLENEKRIKKLIIPKFENFREFAASLNAGLYRNENDYFWVKDYEAKEVSFLGLNSCWASENGDERKIALGYPQVSEAFKLSKLKNRIALMHHPFDWLERHDAAKCKAEIFAACSLVLHGHNHVDNALVIRDPDNACICLGANASYTTKPDGFIGFQFIAVDFLEKDISLKVWPYKLTDRAPLRFAPDRERYVSQEGKPYFIIDTLVGDKEELPEPVVPLEIPVDYKDWIQHFHSTLSIDQLSTKGEVIKIKLPELYIHIETSNPFHKPEKDKREDDIDGNDDKENKEPQSIDIESLLGREGVNCILLRGAAGMGKTTLIKHLAYTLTHDGDNRSLRGFLPVLVFLKDLWPIYEKKLPTGEKITFESLLAAYLEDRNCPLGVKTIQAYLAQDRGLFLLDGLDEVPDSLRPSLVELVFEFQFDHRKNRFLITGRPHGIDNKVMERFGDHLREINPLDKKKIDSFITSWFRAVMGEAVGLADATSSDMIADVGHHEHISVFTQNPLLLTAICLLYQDGKRLPDQRADLYDRIVKNLLYKRFHDPADTDRVGLIEDYLRLLAFRMQERNVKNIESYEAVQFLKEIFPCAEIGDASKIQKHLECLFNEIEPHCGLLSRTSGGEVEFYHRTFQEFLAASYMIDKNKGYQEYLSNGWWEETILLYTGLMSLNRKTESNDVVKTIFEIAEGKKEKEEIQEARRLNILGGKALRDIQGYKRDYEVLEKSRQRLIDIIESDANASIEERFTSGEILGILGDSRLKDIEANFVEVSAGEFTRGSESEEAYDDEKPIRRIYVDAFEISKYPVTNGEYRKFVEAGGYKNQEYWTPEGWEWKSEEEIVEPEYWHDRQWNGANFPVVGVSWYESVAYAEWLSKETGRRYRLPTEAEWEKAARGTDGREYPWGAKIDKNKCNYDECGLDRTSPVGIFPLGESPFGCFDMSGNVWEWCANWFTEDYYKKSLDKNPTGPEKGGDRVLRGGSWGGFARNCRAAYRDFFHPSRRWNGGGFRLRRELH